MQNLIKKKIISAINKIYSKNFKKILQTTKNPYEKKNSLSKIIRILKSLDMKSIKNNTKSL